MVKYIIEVVEINDKEEFFEEVLTGLSQDSEVKIMTSAETLRQEGILQGMQQGKEEGILLGKHEALEMVAINLLRHNEPITKIVELTGLSISEIEKLKKKHL